MTRILIISPDLLQRTQLSDVLGRGGHPVQAFGELNAALRASEPIDWVLVNPVMPGASGEMILDRVRERWPEAGILLLMSPYCPPALLAKCDDYLERDLPADFILRRIDRSQTLSEFQGHRSPMTRDPGYLQPRSRFLTIAEWEIARAARYGSRSLMARVAIDQFAKIRDSAGSRTAEGRRRLLLETVRKLIRSSDLICAWEEDGFAVMLTETSIDGADAFARKLAESFEKAVSAAPDSGTAPSLSFGWAEVCSDASNGASWVEIATQALFAAQRKGPGSAMVARMCDGRVELNGLETPQPGMAKGSRP